MSTKNCSSVVAIFLCTCQEKNGKTVPVILINIPSTDDYIDESLIWTANDINDVVEVPLEVIIKPTF